ncbi:MAG TPA: D-alanine--D-alanine ligase family protein [Bacillota bacterium]|nr:D-alanine--D-alanine ligase family protein [Bacillota bacterium]HPU17410.1 D-alanine--D-alanine ligase family protein [Bacillota bacterium]
MRKKTVCCIFGGNSTEYEVSLQSVTGVLNNIDRNRYDIITIGVTRDGKFYLYDGPEEKIKDDTWCTSDYITPVLFDPSNSDAPFAFVTGGEVRRLHVDCIFPVVHGKNCEDGTLQGMFSLAGVPYVGCGCTASAVCMDKATAKLILSTCGIPQAKYLCFTADEIARGADTLYDAVEEVLSYPVFVKPSAAGSSVGVTKVKSRADLPAALRCAAEHDSKVLVEEYIEGREVEIAVLHEPDGTLIASECGEIDPGSEFYDYAAKYINDTAKYYVPARINKSTQEKIAAVAKKIFTALGCRGFARIDFFVRGHGDAEEVIFNEINTIPGFTPISMYPRLMEYSGVPYGELITRLIEGAGT